MCGRFSLVSPDTILEQLDLAGAFPDWSASFNIAPGRELPCVVNHHESSRRARLLRWGLVPSWAEDPRIGFKMINARRESVATKPSFRDAYARRRCLVLADGFYEWRAEGKKKTPFYFRRRSREPFAFAGLWASWCSKDESEGARLDTVTIITAPANELVAPVHDRMPVIVSAQDYGRWLSPELLEPVAVDDILAHPAYDEFESFEVSRLVSSVSNDGPELIEPGPSQQRLF